MNKTKLILGSKNSGKTTKILFNEVEKNIENNENLLFIDVKKEYYKTYFNKLKSNNYNISVLNLQDPKNSNSWNLLIYPYNLYKSGKTDAAIELVKDIALNICMDDSQSDPFWSESAGNCLASLILILFENAKEEEINLGSLGLLLVSGEKLKDDKLLIKTYLETLDPLNPIYVLASGTAFAPYETRASIISVVRQKLNDYLVRENLMNILNGNEISLSSNHNKTAIFIITEDNSINSLVNIFINQIIKANDSYTFILDNLEVLKPLSNFNNIIENTSGNNFEINVAFRNEDKFKECYGKYAKDMFDEVIYSSDSTLESISVGDCNIYIESTLNKPVYFIFDDFLEENN